MSDSTYTYRRDHKAFEDGQAALTAVTRRYADARFILARALKGYRAAGLPDCAKVLRDKAYWIGYPVKGN